MYISTKLLRKELAVLKPFLDTCSLSATREGQDKLGALMAHSHRRQVACAEKKFDKFKGLWITPKKRIYDGVILYLHGGGYVAGGLEYARGFGTILCAKNKVNVFCAAYRLAPEHKFPCALEDVFLAYKYLLTSYDSKKIIICGESAGGGLCYSLCAYLKEKAIPLPRAIIALSPWCDLTQSGNSHISNNDKDPSLSKERLDYFASQYTNEPADPLSSPLFADLCGMPDSLIFAGGDEVLLSDSIELNSRLNLAGCTSELVVKKSMWHVYPLYSTKESKDDYERIGNFIREHLS